MDKIYKINTISQEEGIFSDLEKSSEAVPFDFSLIEVKDDLVSARNLYKFLNLAEGQFSR
jgi:hypothetical protein